MHTFIKQDKVWVVGHYRTDEDKDVFVPMAECTLLSEALQVINYLNGGNGVPFSQSKSQRPSMYRWRAHNTPFREKERRAWGSTVLRYSLLVALILAIIAAWR